MCEGYHTLWVWFMKQTFYIFRHALATKSDTGYGDEIETAGILPEGIPPIEKLAVFLQTITSDYNVSSGFLRCRQTSEIVSEITGKHFAFDKRLSEFYDETPGSFIDKVKNFLEEMERKKYKNIIICTHAAVIAVMIKMLMHRKIIPKDLYTNYPKPGMLLIIEDKKIEEKDFTDWRVNAHIRVKEQKSYFLSQS